MRPVFENAGQRADIIHTGEMMMVESRNIQIFEKMPVAKAVSSMAVPTVIGQLIILFYNMADTFFVGQTNNPYMVAGAAPLLPGYYNFLLYTSDAAAQR